MYIEDPIEKVKQLKKTIRSGPLYTFNDDLSKKPKVGRTNF
jgi:hypothetical protein